MESALRTMRSGEKAASLLAEQGCLFAVLDSCDSPPILAKVIELGPGAAPSLYKGAAEESLFDIAPYFVRVDRNLLAWLKHTVSHEPWGILAVARREHAFDIEQMYRHLRKFLIAVTPGGGMYFRYYDPRVLGPFLKSCTVSKLDEVFGPFSMFGTADEYAEPAENFSFSWYFYDEAAARASIEPSLIPTR